MTLVEVAVATAITAMVILGLVIVYLFGVDTWLRARHRMVAQNAGGRAVYAIGRAARRASRSSAAVIDGGATLRLGYPLYEGGDAAVAISLRDNALVAEGAETWSVPEQEGDSLVVLAPEDNRVFVIDSAGATVSVRFGVASIGHGALDTVYFTTTMAMRNL
jgi:type II secretory pathway pseudopilin PulG